ncbi:MAG: thioredoxin domain-containing protein, partial [Bacteroidia bacterium]
LLVPTLLWSQKMKKTYTVEGMKVEIEGNVLNKNFVPDGEVKTFYADGTPALQGAYIKGKANGIWKQFYPNGKLKTENTYQEGVMVGLFSKYYDNGKKAAEWTYQNGQMNGQVKYYMKNGKPKATYSYRDNILFNAEWYQDNRLISQFDLLNKKLVKGNSSNSLKFKRICIYDQAENLECKTVDEFVRDLAAEGFSETQIADILSAMQKAWDEMGLQGDVMVQCAGGLLGVSGNGFTLSDMSKVTKKKNISVGNFNKGNIPTAGMGNMANNSFKSRVDDACSKASLGGINGGGGSSGGAGGNPSLGSSPNKGLIDNAVKTMDAMVANCRDGGNSMIMNPVAAGGALAFLEKLGTILGVIDGVTSVYGNLSEDNKIASFTTDGGNKVDVYKTGVGDYIVHYEDLDVKVSDRRGGGYVVQAQYMGSNGKTTRQTCSFDGEGNTVQCKYQQSSCVSNCEGATDWKDAPAPDNAVPPADMKKAADDVDCAKKAGDGTCTPSPPPPAPTPPPAGGSTPSKPNPDGNGGKCAAMKAAWARQKAECEQSGWQSFSCIEFVRFWNKCAGDIRVAQPTPDGDLYFGCGNKMSEAEAREKACEKKKMIWLTGIDGLNANGECKKPTDLTIPSPFADPCGPNATPDPERGCNPMINVPSENPVPGGGPNPVRPFSNNNLNNFAEHSQHNQFHNQLTKQQKGRIETKGLKLLEDENYNTELGMAKPVMVIFASNNCTPSLNYLNTVKNGLPELGANVEVRVVNIEQNPELFQKYNIQITPTTLILDKSKERKRLIGVQSKSELLQNIK